MLNPTFCFSPELQTFLSGRSLLAIEIPFPEKLIHDHVNNGMIKKIPGIEKKHNEWYCNRCGNQTKRLFVSFPCANCKSNCFYCRKCIMMGRISTCTSLFQWAGPHPEWESLLPTARDPYLVWDGQLSPAQEAASKAAVQAVKNKSDLLVWAVCGAGKTEVLFAAINEALRTKKRVCLATPRTDVVLELAPRLTKVFPEVPIAVLYGGSEDRYVQAALTISTTHQLFRFYQAFDMVIVDEVDAFPYSYDESLQWAVKKSAKLGATQLFLTATPSATWQFECKRGKRNFIKIPARFHRKPLPLPQFVWCGNWRRSIEKATLPAPVLHWVRKRLEMQKQSLLFFPHIHLMEKSLSLFKQLHPKIEAVHAQDPNRKEKVEKMREREIPLLLTTTILERGVTFPNIDVAIIGAEDDIFTEAALVQIAGRVGRSPEFPTGTITFFHHGRTNAMVRALVHINQMNKEAKERGMVDR